MTDVGCSSIPRGPPPTSHGIPTPYSSVLPHFICVSLTEMVEAQNNGSIIIVLSLSKASLETQYIFHDLNFW